MGGAALSAAAVPVIENTSTSFTRRSAMAAPVPRPAPVTIATLLVMSSSKYTFCVLYLPQDANASHESILPSRVLGLLGRWNRSVTPSLPICRRSEPEHDRSPGAITLDSGSQATTPGKDSSAERLQG